VTPEPGSTTAARPSGAALVGLTLLALLELALLGWALATGAALLFAVGQALLLMLLCLGIVGTRFLRFRRDYELTLARSAAERERGRLAEELHDVLGHELSLVALRAGSLQVSTEGDVADRAATLRMQVERVVLQLRQTVEMLRDGREADAVPQPVDVDTQGLVERTRAAGTSISLAGAMGDVVPAPVRLAAYGVVREGVTNALKHSPGSPVLVRQWNDSDSAHVEVEVSGDADEGRTTWSGLASLDDRLRALGGSITVTGRNGRRVLAARIPVHIDPRARSRGAAAERTGRRPGVATIRWFVPPLAVTIAASTAFYAWSTHGATLEPSIFGHIHAGQTVQDVRPVLPRREAVIHLTRLPAVSAGWDCAYYTDGNFPLGMAAFEICDDGSHITRTTDLRKEPLP
jgi:signal transduction histidine kinase